MALIRTALTASAAALLAGTALTGTALAAGSAPQAPAICGMQPQWCPTVTKLPATVTILPGTVATLTLPTNVTTGYRWIVVSKPCCTSNGTAVAKVSKGVYKAPDTSMPGAPGTTTWKITGLRPGKGSVIIATRPPGVQNTMQDEEVGRLKVIVKKGN